VSVRAADLHAVPSHAASWLRALRPRQWPKNLLLFAGLLFAGELADPTDLLRALAIFAAYCAVSSAAYLLNDVHDAEQDRRHPTKRLRPLASREISAPAALAAATLLAAGGLALAARLGLGSLGLLAAFAALQLAYTLGLKRVALVDVAAIGSLFVLRAAAGAEALEVRISPWLLGCTLLLALFLAFAKRRAELVLLLDDLTRARSVLRTYSVRLLDRLVVATAAAAVAVYAVYAATDRAAAAMVATVPFAALGLGRYLYLVRRRDLGEEPEEVLLTDPVTILSVACWAAIAAALLTNS
jgi:4-hydroxybenzoate polyprenyltransferase